MMIISASYKTDIPAFYGPWFAARLAAGSVSMVNPWNGQTSDLLLTRDSVDGFVFWTRNAAPFSGVLADVGRHWPFVVQYTVTGYPGDVERSVPPVSQAVDTIRALAREFGRRKIVWRYDPILVSSLTPANWHVEHFAKLAKRLEGATDEVVVSFVQVYAKTKRNLDRAAGRYGFTWFDPEKGDKQALLGRLGDIAAAHGMRLGLCAQPELVPERVTEGIVPALCIDPSRLFGANHDKSYRRSKNRTGCLCAEARDIGQYETCPHACVYCYAVNRAETAKANYRRHDRADPSLIIA